MINNCEKYPDKGPTQLIKLLFHGSGRGGATPKVIYESEDGLDIRFAQFGNSGQGTYFADNSQYSHTYAYLKNDGGEQVYQMFVCFVLPGETVQDPPDPRHLRIPPFKNGQDGVRYDSVGQ